nr:retrovirus-related Pol polyprotein from transposon TNT 1-94 [Tanacetum cinerariifolium]
MSRDVLTVGSTMRIPLLYQEEYSQWVERFMNYLEEQTNGKAMINSIKNDDQPLPRVTQVSIAGTTSTEQPPLKDKSMWSDQEKRVQKIDHLSRSFLIQDEVVNLLEKEKVNLEIIESLKSKNFESSEKVCSESENQSENDYLVIEKQCDKEENLKIVQICLWIIDSGCSKHMTGNRALLTNFVEKFLRTVRFGNNDFAVIAGY